MTKQTIDLGAEIRAIPPGPIDADACLRFAEAEIIHVPKGRLEIGPRLIFENCTFPESAIRFPGWKLLGGLTFRNCEFAGQLTLENCSIDGDLTLDGCWAADDTPIVAFTLRACSIRGTAVVSDCRFPGIPRIESCHFRGPMRYSPPPQPAPAFCPHFSRVEFESELYVEIPAAQPSIRFHHCAFGNRSQTELSLPDEETAIDFTGSVLEGNLRAQAYLDLNPSAVTLELKGTEVRGSVDLRALRPRWLNPEDAILRSGTLMLDRKALAQRMGAKDLFARRILAADRTGLLLREQFVADPIRFLNLVPLSWRHDPCAHVEEGLVHLEQVSREYEELCNMFAATDGSDWQEDFCRYKFMEYRRIHFRALAGRLYNSLAGAVGAVAVTFLVWLTCCPTEWLGFVFIGFFLIAVLPLPFPKYRAARFALWSRVVNRAILGHGVIIRRILLSAITLIVGFAALYGFSTHIQPNVGRVVHSFEWRRHRNPGLWIRPPTRRPAGVCERPLAELCSSAYLFQCSHFYDSRLRRLST